MQCLLVHWRWAIRLWRTRRLNHAVQSRHVKWVVAILVFNRFVEKSLLLFVSLSQYQFFKIIVIARRFACKWRRSQRRSRCGARSCCSQRGKFFLRFFFFLSPSHNLSFEFTIFHSNSRSFIINWLLTASNRQFFSARIVLAPSDAAHANSALWYQRNCLQCKEPTFAYRFC